jgi:hypothetical protein
VLDVQMAAESAVESDVQMVAESDIQMDAESLDK